MHQSNEKCTPAEPVHVFMRALQVLRTLDGMRMQMEVSSTILMAMSVEMDAFSPQAPQNVSAKCD
jgi:hypothetical protein